MLDFKQQSFAGRETVKYLQVQYLTRSPVIQETLFRPGSMLGREGIQAGVSLSQGMNILGITVSSTDCFRKKQVIVMSPM